MPWLKSRETEKMNMGGITIIMEDNEEVANAAKKQHHSQRVQSNK